MKRVTILVLLLIISASSAIANSKCEVQKVCVGASYIGTDVKSIFQTITDYEIKDLQECVQHASLRLGTFIESYESELISSRCHALKVNFKYSGTWTWDAEDNRKKPLQTSGSLISDFSD